MRVTLTPAGRAPARPRDVFDAMGSDDEDDDVLSASSTLTVSPSPRRNLANSGPSSFATGSAPVMKGELPPSYAHLEAEAKQKVRREFIQRWQPDVSPTPAVVNLPVTAPSSPSPPTSPGRRALHLEATSGEVDDMSFDEISREAVEKWKILKNELGVDCQVIERALMARRPVTPARGAEAVAAILSPTQNRLLTAAEEQHVRTLTPRMAREWANQVKAAAEAEDVEPDAPGSPVKKAKTPRWQFYNMYNSVFYPTTETPAERDNAPRRNWNVTLTGVGVWALVFMTG